MAAGLMLAAIRVLRRFDCACLPALFALADQAQVLVAVDSGIVPVAPVDADGIIAHRFHGEHLERRLKHLKRIVGFRLARGCSMRSGALRAGALVAQVLEAVLAMVAALPIDFDALGLGNGDVFGVGGNRHDQLKRRSTSRTPEMRRMAVTNFSSCFLSRTSTVISTIPPPCSSSVLASRLRMLVFSPRKTEVSW